MKNLKVLVRVLQAGVVIGFGVLAWQFISTPAPVAQTSAAEPEATTTESPSPQPKRTAATSLEDKWGIQVNSVSLTNNATAVQVQYTVVDPEKTLLLSGTNDARVYLLNEATGAKLSMIAPPQPGTVPQGASLRTTRRMMRFAGRFPPTPSRLIAGATYSLEIPNWGLALQTGNKVSLVVGDTRQDGLFVE